MDGWLDGDKNERIKLESELSNDTTLTFVDVEIETSKKKNKVRARMQARIEKDIAAEKAARKAAKAAKAAAVVAASQNVGGVNSSQVSQTASGPPRSGQPANRQVFIVCFTAQHSKFSSDKLSCLWSSVC